MKFLLREAPACLSRPNGMAGELRISNHIISRRRYRTPEDYADTFKVMGEAGAFPEEFLKNPMDMARIRNRLVHLYWRVDKKEIYKILHDNLSDFEKFLEYLGKFIGEEIG